MKVSLRAAKAWHWERPAEVFDEGAGSIAVEGSGLGPFREAEAWQQAESPGEAPGESAA